MEKIYKNEIQRLMPLFQAIAEGKTIQWNDMGVWRDIDGDDEGFFLDTFVGKTVDYRIKPEPKYRPFKDVEECWKEMLQHSPLGWVKFQGDWLLIVHIDDKSIGYGSACGAIIHSKFDSTLKSFTFADGTPFGILEEE